MAGVRLTAVPGGNPRSGAPGPPPPTIGEIADSLLESLLVSGERKVSRGSVTILLSALKAGDRPALDRLFEAVYEELRRLARAQLARSADSTLSATALVNEAYLKFVRSGGVGAADRNHFYSIAARAMRQILVDHARKRLADRRGGGQEVVSLGEWDGPVENDLVRILAIDDALEKLAAREPRLARLVECRVFGGMTVEEISESSGVSLTTLKRDWRKARAFLFRELG